MATESVLPKTQPDFLCPKSNNDIWVGVVENSPSSFVEVTLRPRSGSQANLSLVDTPSRAGSSLNKSDKNDATLFPSILDFRRSSTAKTSSFGLLSEGFYHENDSSNVTEKEGSSDDISADLKSNEDRSGGKDMTLEAHTYKAAKRKHGKSKKKSHQAPVLKRSQTVTHLIQAPKSADGASQLKLHVTSQSNVTTGLNILTAQCKAVKIHQHTESKSKISAIPNSFHKRLNIFAKPTDLSHQRSVLKSTNHILRESQCSKGDNSKKYNSSSSPPVHLARRSLSQAESVYLQRVTKVYLSEKHSGVIKEGGTEFPCAPPATPTPEQLRKYEYVPSLNDVRSQRAFRQKLQVMERKELQKEEKRREEQARMDRLHQRDKESELRRRQRQEIYALNKIMTELEHKRFGEFCRAKGINS